MEKSVEGTCFLIILIMTLGLWVEGSLVENVLEWRLHKEQILTDRLDVKSATSQT